MGEGEITDEGKNSVEFINALLKKQEAELVARIKPVSHEPSIVEECWREKLFYQDGLCLATTFYSCRYQNKLAKPVLKGERPCYECSQHNRPAINDIVDLINRKDA
jgi:hypothetical protein